MTWKELQPCLVPASASQPPDQGRQGKARRKLQPAAGLGKPLTKAPTASAAPSSNKPPLTTGALTNSKGNAAVAGREAHQGAPAVSNSKAPLPSAIVTSSRAPAKGAVKSSKGHGTGTAKHKGCPMREREEAEEDEGAELANEGFRHDNPTMARVAAGRQHAVLCRCPCGFTILSPWNATHAIAPVYAS